MPNHEPTKTQQLPEQRPAAGKLAEIDQFSEMRSEGGTVMSDQARKSHTGGQSGRASKNNCVSPRNGANYTAKPIEMLLSRLDKPRKIASGKWLACCPAHADKTPSLSIRESDNGGALVYCFGGCDVQSVLSAIGLSLADLFPPNLDHQTRKPQTLTPEQRQHYASEQRRRQQEEQRLQAQAAQHCRAIWNQSTPCTKHPYLTSKGIKAHGLRVDRFGNLLIPVIGPDGALASLQYIKADGQKRFHKGGSTKGGHFVIGNDASKLLLAEGYATGATLHEETGFKVFVGFNAGNLESVAVLIRARYPESIIVVCADNDPVGLEKGRSAALAVNGLLAVPPVPGEDFNDMARDGNA